MAPPVLTLAAALTVLACCGAPGHPNGTHRRSRNTDFTKDGVPNPWISGAYNMGLF